MARTGESHLEALLGQPGGGGLKAYGVIGGPGGPPASGLMTTPVPVTGLLDFVSDGQGRVVTAGAAGTITIGPAGAGDYLTIVGGLFSAVGGGIGSVNLTVLLNGGPAFINSALVTLDSASPVLASRESFVPAFAPLAAGDVLSLELSSPDSDLLTVGLLAGSFQIMRV